MTDPAHAVAAHTNRLSRESSPYLLQHAHNPVDWYPWGPEAFAAAKAQDKPIFLSVGYSTCYWCHVMERQSFETEAVAAEMNARFINIKVDREERPDVDQLYMTAVQVLTRQGGWPMSVFLMPDLRPFYGGTYFPPTDQYGRPGFTTLLRGIDDAWRNRRNDVEQTAAQLRRIVQQLAEPPAPDEPVTIDRAFVDALIDRSVSDYDTRNGGFGSAPKFPRETLIELLLTYLAANPAADKDNDKRRTTLRRMVDHTLDALARGGIRDQLGGGFHRYSTDAKWLVPHFEIMLYDNAMLAWCYAEAHRQTADPRWAATARGVLDFVLREMTSPAGAFYTAFDAEVDAQEGKSYLWTPAEVSAVLGADDAAVFNRVYGVDRGPNFADPHHGSGTPDQNILFLPDPIPDVAKALNTTPGELEARLDPMRRKLYAARSKRKQPLLDTKVITSWNALMIRAFAHAGHVLKEPTYLEAASRAADFLLRHHRVPDGTLRRTSGGGLTSVPPPRGTGTTADLGDGAVIPAFLDDYAFLTQALLALHAATGNVAWRDRAAELAAQLRARFGDDEAGGFYFTARDATDLIVRQKVATDSPLPSGNAVAALALLELGQPDAARETLAAFSGQLAHQGESMGSMVQAALRFLAAGDPFRVTAAPDASADDRPLPPAQVAASVVSARATRRGDREVLVTLSVLAGFHVNAHDTSGADVPLIPTTLTARTDAGPIAVDVEYPPGEEQRFAFAENPVRVYSGDVTILLRFPNTVPSGTTIAVSYQACDEGTCLPPTTKQVAVP